MRSEHDDLGADVDAAVQVDHVLIAHPDAARRYVGADGPWLVRAVNAVQRGAEIHGAGAERILRAAFHVPRQIGTARQRFRRRRPGRPFLLGRNRLDARPGEAGTADADAVTQRPAIALHQEQELVRRVDHDGAGAFLAVVLDRLLFIPWIEGRTRRLVRILLTHRLLRIHRRQQRAAWIVTGLRLKAPARLAVAQP